MRNVTVVKSEDVEVKPFNLRDFGEKKDRVDTLKVIGKRELKELAKDLNLKYDDKNITFAKKLLNAYIKSSV